ncbi:MAG: GMC family oxidoreductase [Hyphomicrobium sp.]
MSPRVERTDICIIGTGAAGGILAYRLAMAGRDVLSLEQGDEIRDDYFTNGFSPEQDEHFGIAPDKPWPVPTADAYFDENAQAARLYARANTTSTTQQSSAVFRNRQVFRLNGKQNLWAGVSLRYSERDFKARDFGDGDLNWPIGYSDLAPHYTAIERLIGVCGTREGIAELPDGEFLPSLPMRPIDNYLLGALSGLRDTGIRAIPNRKAIETRPEAANVCRQCGLCVHGCRTGSIYKFSSRLLPLIAGRPNYQIRYGTKVIALRRSPSSSRIELAECLDTRTRETFTIRANVFVVAAGALETARVLLNSHDETNPDGLANSSGLVGRGLQDNVRVMTSGSLWKFAGQKANYLGGVGDHLLIPRFLFEPGDFRGGFQVQVGHTLPWLPFYLEPMRRIPARLKDYIARRLFCTYLGLIFFGKPTVQADNRLTVSDRRDDYGVPQVDVHYRWGDNDLKMQRAMADWGGKIMKASSAIGVSHDVDGIPGKGIHYGGTCRMASTRGEGVVGGDCRTFDHPNLYLCDGGIMPDLSEKNPTLTIMALANRLAETLVQSRTEIS